MELGHVETAKKSVSLLKRIWDFLNLFERLGRIESRLAKIDQEIENRAISKLHALKQWKVYEEWRQLGEPSRDGLKPRDIEEHWIEEIREARLRLDRLEKQDK